MPTYPLTPPAALRAARCSLALPAIAASQPNPYTGAEKVFDWGDGPWVVTFDFAGRGYDRGGAEIEAFILALRGKVGSFLFTPPTSPSPRGSVPVGGLAVAGAGQNGRTIQLSAASAWTLKADDWFSIGTGSAARLYRVTQDAASGAGHVGAVEFVPALRASPADAAAVTVAGAFGVFGLEGNSNPVSMVPPSRIASGSLSFRERL